MTRAEFASHSPDMQRRSIWLGLLLMAGLLWWCLPAHAADDPPGRVGRVTESQGQSWVFDGEANEWLALQRNRPLTTGDRIAVEDKGRLELRIGSTTVRLSGGSDFQIGRLDDDRIDMVLQAGSAAVRVRSAEVAREVEVATAEGRFIPQSAGHYRIDRHDDTSYASALSGQLRFEAADSALDIAAGRGAELWREGSGNATHYSWTEPPQDEFTDWVARASREDDRIAAPSQVSPEMTGAEDLERNGQWDTHAEYGAVWYPTTVVAGWAPYRYGHWTYLRPWGWTWVDDAPWGFAPFHYGRWVMVSNRWCWAPGRYVARPIFAPALVAWIGGPRHGATVTVGGPPYVGWVPLAPREPYYPHYATGGRYWRAVNHAQLNMFPTNTPRTAPTTAIMYTNQRLPNAVSVVPSAALQQRRPVAPVVAQVDAGVRERFITQPGRTHVPPPGVARAFTPPGQAAIAPPGQSPMAPRGSMQVPTTPRQPLPGTMAQPGTPPTALEPRREQIPRMPPVPPNANAQSPGAQSPGAQPPSVRFSPGLQRPPQAAVVPPAQPPAPIQPAAPTVQQPRVAPPRAAVMPPSPAPAVQPPAAVQPAQPPAQRRFDPGEGGGMRRDPGRSSSLPMQPPQARGAAPPATAVPTPRGVERAAPPQHAQPPREVQRAPEARHPEARVRIPESKEHSGRNRMQ